MPVVAALAAFSAVDQEASKTACVGVLDVVVIVGIRFLLFCSDRVGGRLDMSAVARSCKSVFGRLCEPRGALLSGAKTLASFLPIAWVQTSITEQLAHS